MLYADPPVRVTLAVATPLAAPDWVTRLRLLCQPDHDDVSTSKDGLRVRFPEGISRASSVVSVSASFTPQPRNPRTRTKPHSVRVVMRRHKSNGHADPASLGAQGVRAFGCTAS